MRVGLAIPGGWRRADPALCHPAMRGDPGIRALLVQAGPLETDRVGIETAVGGGEGGTMVIGEGDKK